MASNPIDAAAFAELQASTDAEFVVELVEAFLADAPPLLKTLHETLAGRDSVAFRRAAHSLKSNGNAFGAFAFSALARELEETGLETMGERAGPALERLEAAYADAAAALKVLCRG
jgi:HPt (histidine-containing phosphotransfer) domain-containing protein